MRARTLLATVAVLAATAGTADAATFSNPAKIPIANPVRTDIQVQGMTGRVSHVHVTLLGVHHEFGNDADVLLVAPDGQHSIVLSDACAGITAPRSWTFEQSQPRFLGSAPSGCDLGFYRPTQLEPSTDAFPGAPPAGARTYEGDFDRFLGAQPNGTWQLHVNDDDPTAFTGAIDRGWVLQLETTDAPVTVPGPVTDGAASQYPLTTTFGAEGDTVIEDVDVTIGGVSHSRAEDLEVLVVGPSGRQVKLLSDTCGRAVPRGARWTFDDEAPVGHDEARCTSGGAIRPSDVEPGDRLPGAAPQDGEVATSLSAFDGTDPDGAWKVYVADDDLPNGRNGFLAQDVSLTLKLRKAAEVGLESTGVSVPEGERGVVTVVRPAAGRSLGPASVRLSSAPGSAASGADFVPVSTTVAFAAGQTSRRVPVEALTDGEAEPTEAFVVTLSDAKDDAVLGAERSVVVTIPGTEASPPVPSTPPVAPVVDAAGGPTADPPPADRVAPALGRVSLVRTKAGRRARFTLGEPAAVTVRVLRGRKVVATVRRAGRAGVNRIALPARAIRPRGRYRVEVRAVDAAGNRAVAAARTFRVGAKRR